jgi:hypothetical protein
LVQFGQELARKSAVLTIGFDGGQVIENEFAVEHDWL